MPTSPGSFKTTTERLIRRFESDRTHYLSKSYSEAQARVDFITPFFKALGWDVENEEGLAHHAREVVVEAAEDTRGRPDYGFRVSGQTKFFVEAKAPSEELDTAKHIIQAKTYAWNTKQVFLVVLTDFEEFRFYDASIKPDARNPDEGLLLKLRYTEYIASLDKLWEFSRERVLAGSLETMLPRDRRTQRLRIPVDTAFLDEMTGWREELAKNIYKNNPGLTAKQLNEIVQRLLDRIVFIRIAEDRRVIEKNQLRDVVEEWKARGGKLHIFDWLNDLFHRVNEDFNGEIFKPHLSEEIKIESDVLAHIIERLYPPKSPYRFDVIGVELLGSIYERYLGKTIRPTAKQVRVEEKPEVRKAGGVYYTPEYIVKYIVQTTVGKVIEGKSPKQIEKIRILDPACGSGSFLIGAFQCLIDYHVRYLTEHPKEAQVHPLFPDVIKDANGEPRLSVIRKAKILKNNLFGVDIDPQAVEITMMSLYLKALEGERAQLPPKQHLLPELKYNVICGNSLIGPDIYEQGTLFGDADRDRINAFDWNSEGAGFERIMKDGGFDCVIANPPYIRIQTLQEFSPIEADYLKRRYITASSGNFDIYVCFVEKGLSVLHDSGRLGFILPSKFFQTDYGKPLRELLVNKWAIESVVDFSHLQVFDGPTTYTCLLFLTRASRQTVQYTRIEDAAKLPSLQGQPSAVPVTELSSGPWVFAGRRERRIFEKMESHSIRLIDLPSEISRGSSSGADNVFIVQRTERSGVYASKDGQTVRLEPGILRIPLYATGFSRYYFGPESDERIIFPYRVNDGSSSLIEERDLKREFPRAFDYLRTRRHLLDARKQFTTWFSYSAPRNLSLHDSADLLVPLLADRGLFSEFPGGQHRFCMMASGGFSIKAAESVRLSPKYLLGLLNSKLLFTYLKSKSNVFRGGWITCTKQYVGPLPIRFTDKDRHDQIVALVERMLEMNRKKHSGKLAPSDTQRLDCEIAATDVEIEDVVLQIYGITSEERKIIEAQQ
ncbi:MAG TPA: N-6 DNA methylase [Candidatus Acidoferrales bacterium]|nr:N-6 DNA methylase [Candidatus Acidoferrales bacterium]HEV3480931.1 N-6 DNA methylase [Candidatus Acidoferrales bacterium]